MILRQILINLLSNEIKFTKFGSVTLRARGSQAEGSVVGKCSISFEVEDTGLGVAPEEMNNIMSG